MVEGGVSIDRVSNGKVTTNGIFRDITLRKQTEETLRQSGDELRIANDLLERAARLKDEFLANMSHELRTPLNAILTFSESLLEEIPGPLNDRQKDWIQNIEGSGMHLLSLINDILDMSKVEAGQMELHFEDVAVVDVCQASLLFVKEMALKKKLKLAFQLDNQLAEIEADPKRLKQILVNLLSNAVKFTPPGGMVSLDVRVDEDAGVIRYVVQDTGVGIAAADIARLFQPFTQLDSSLSRQHEGTGLGLALVRRLTELHGGSVTVESEPGAGSRFMITLPYRPVMGLTKNPDTSQLNPFQGKMTVLVVEDMPSVAAQLVHYLQEMKIEAVVQFQGMMVVEQAIQLQPTAILLDLLMPDQSGWDILAHLKAEPQTRAIPVVIVSVVDEQSRGLAAGAAAYLVKPVSREMLRQALGRVAAAKSSPHPTPPEPKTAGAHILLAEDNEINVLAIADFLKSRNYQITVAKTGREAIEMIFTIHPDLVLMDIQMPEMDGLEAIYYLRAMPEFATMPIIALTALAMPGDRERCLSAGVNEYLTKPVSLKGLVAAIETLLPHKTAASSEQLL
ncbi:MAG: response regulator [Chloroflexi bacterium]|nr:response regulator [Chloroflexota bacterium]